MQADSSQRNLFQNWQMTSIDAMVATAMLVTGAGASARREWR